MLQHHTTRMTRYSTILFVLLLCSVLFLGQVSKSYAAPKGVQAKYYVAPNGSDTNPGTIDQPFQTIEHARQVVSQYASNMRGDILVYLRQGTYPLSQTLQFGSGDSGTNGYNVVYQAYPGEKPLVSGGQSITGWTLHDGSKNIWQATVGTQLQTRQLYVNGVRAIRTWATAGILGSIQVNTSGYVVSNTQIQQWSNPSDLEFVYSGSASNPGAPWTESRCGVASISPFGNSTSIIMKQPCFNNGTQGKGSQSIANPSSIENNYALLDQPGEWYLDSQAGTLYYIPRPGEDLQTADVVAPVLETLVSGIGTPNAPIHNIQFRGITFAYATWLQPSGNDGYIELQAGEILVGNSATYVMAPANISIKAGHDIRFERDTFIHLGAQGLSIDGGSQKDTVIGSIFTDISGTGVRIGNVDNPGAQGPAQDTGNIFTDNYVHDLPVEYHGGVGIFGGYLANTTISHNEVANLPYTGISLGWGWGQVSYATNNTISYNKVHDVMGHLLDGGNVYVLGPQPNSQTPVSSMKGNWINNDPQPYGSLYLDEGSQGWNVNNNVVSTTSTNWVYVQICCNQAYYNWVEYNYADTSTFVPGNNTNKVDHNTVVNGDNWPPAAKHIMKNAGIEPRYRDIIGAGVPSNVAVEKAASASSTWSSDYAATKANDENASSGWSPLGTDSSPWWEVDLGHRYTLSQIQFVTRQDIDQPATRHNFEIWASNTADMSRGHVVLGGQGVDILPFQSTWILNVNTNVPYRYIALVKTTNEYAFISELRVFGLLPTKEGSL